MKMRLNKLLAFPLVLLVSGLIAGGIDVQHAHAQVINIYPGTGGTYEPLADAGLWAYAHGHRFWSETLGINDDGTWQTVENAAAYVGNGTEPMVCAGVHDKLYNYFGWSTTRSADAYAQIGWPFLVFDKNKLVPLDETWTQPVHMQVRFRMHALASYATFDTATLAEADFGLRSRDEFGQTVQYYANAYIGAVGGDFKQGHESIENTTKFTLSGPPWYKLYMTLTASASVRIVADQNVRISDSGEAEAVADPYLCIDPEYPEADQLEVRTLNSTDAPEDDLASWVPAVETPIDFIPTSVTTMIVDTDPRTVNATGIETTKIYGNLTSAGTGLEGRTISLYYQNASAEYETPNGTWTHMANASTGSGGYYEYEWNPEDALATGHYCIKANFGGDDYYFPSSTTTGVDTIPNPIVVPEMPMQTMAALTMMMLTSAEMAVIRKKRIIKPSSLARSSICTFGILNPFGFGTKL